jgi:Skp family chaperone for outer membrane proteins
MAHGRCRAIRLAVGLLIGLAAAPVGAQQAVPFLFINQEHILTGSKAGKALLDEEEQARDKLRAEARALDSAFEQEERQLTEQRPKLGTEEFRKLADAFDERVVTARREQDNRATALAQEFDQKRRAFYAQVAPILVMLMDRYHARAIFDENSVLLADQALNITDEVIAELDSRPPHEGAPEAAPAPPDAVPEDSPLAAPSQDAAPGSVLPAIPPAGAPPATEQGE